MNEIGKLSNQHFLEWESHLEHIDELMGKAQVVHAKEPEGSDIRAQLTDIRKNRDALALDLASVRNLPESEQSNATKRAHGLTTAFAAVGLQLEKMLASVVNLK